MALYDLMLSPAGMAFTGGHLRVTHHHQAMRLAALVAVAAAYVGIRQTVTGGEQLVSIYRKVSSVENLLHLSKLMHTVLL